MPIIGWYTARKPLPKKRRYLFETTNAKENYKNRKKNSERFSGPHLSARDNNLGRERTVNFLKQAKKEEVKEEG